MIPSVVSNLVGETVELIGDGWSSDPTSVRCDQRKGVVRSVSIDTGGQFILMLENMMDNMLFCVVMAWGYSDRAVKVIKP